MTARRTALGALGEDAAAAWYIERGYRVVARNWRVREGELDLVVCNATTTVFCEVKTRSSSAFGAPFEAVTVTKQRRIRSLAVMFLTAQPQPGRQLRFDVASVTPGAHAPKVDVIEAAF